MYDLAILKSQKISRPVISIGNITTGGTGKTPLVVFTAKYFLEKGKTVGIVARGYKRDSKGIVIVCDGKSVNNNVSESGDELILISNELIKKYNKCIYAAAGSDRTTAAELLINKFNPDIIILDDGFQHRKIKRDLDIVILDTYKCLSNNFFNKFLLPSGNLRENSSSFKRADIIIQNNKNSEHSELVNLLDFKKPLVLIRYKTEYFMDNKNCILRYKQQPVVLFSGIANDESFIEMVKSNNIQVSKVIKYSDHHNYVADDVKYLAKSYSKGNIFITTEKDFVKIKSFETFINNFPVYYLKLDIEITKNGVQFYNKLDSLIK